MKKIRIFLISGIIVSSSMGLSQVKNQQPSPTTPPTIQIDESKQVCLKTTGEDKRQTLVKIQIHNDIYRVIQYPFFDNKDEESDSNFREYSIGQALEAIHAGKPLGITYHKANSDQHTLVFSVTAADLDSETITIKLGPTIESFDCTTKIPELPSPSLDWT